MDQGEEYVIVECWVGADVSKPFVEAVDEESY
jgi:hypothetical protein